MKNFAVRLIVLMLFSISLIPISVNSEESNQKITIYVDDDNINGPWDGSYNYPYRFIQEGINASNYNDIVFVQNGIYYEELEIDKSIILQGENTNKTIIERPKRNITGGTVHIKSDNIKMVNFTIQNSGFNKTHSGIYITSKNNIIRSNRIFNYSWGIEIYFCHNANNQIENNILNRNSVGISIYHSDNNSIISNKINLNSTKQFIEGIELLYSCYNYICDNNIYNNSDGIHLINSKYNTIVSNKCLKIERGLALSNSSFNYIKYNEFIDKKSSYKKGVGISIFDSSYNIIFHNNIIRYENFGIYNEESHNNIISFNGIINNFYGVQFVDSINNSIINNNFIDNERHACFLNSRNDWQNNFWGRKMILPKPIVGSFFYDIFFNKNIRIYCLQFDLNPAKEPNNISGLSIS